jgi:PAS domain S-box-containing protein
VKPAPLPRPAKTPDSIQIDGLRARLTEAEETLRAIRSGEVDAVVVAGDHGPRIFTLEGAEHAYRVLIESMNEGALTLTSDGTILYANECFARMVQSPLEQVTGSSLRRFLPREDRATLRPLLARAAKSGSKVQVRLTAADGSSMPAQISIRPLEGKNGDRATVGMVVTDMTAARRNEELLRALSRGLVQAQEDERGRVALDLHDNITQLLCAVLIQSQALADKLSASDGPSRDEAMKLRDMLGQTADEVERISRDLRPSVLDQLGLVAVLRVTSQEFADRTGVALTLALARLPERLPAATELTLYRILQEALRNVEQHAAARSVSVKLSKQGAFARLAIHDDGVGFDAGRPAVRENGKRGLGLVAMRERATTTGGTLVIASTRAKGTDIVARVPLRSGA